MRMQKKKSVKPCFNNTAMQVYSDGDAEKTAPSRLGNLATAIILMGCRADSFFPQKTSYWIPANGNAERKLISVAVFLR